MAVADEQANALRLAGQNVPMMPTRPQYAPLTYQGSEDVEKTLQALSDATNAGILQQQGNIGQLQNTQKLLLGQTPQVNLSPTMSLIDSWTGSNLQKGYVVPETPEQRQAVAQQLQQQIAQAQMGLTREQQAQLKESLQAQLERSKEQAHLDIENRKNNIDQDTKDAQNALKGIENANTATYHSGQLAQNEEKLGILRNKAAKSGQPKPDSLVAAPGVVDENGLPVYRFKNGSQPGYFDSSGQPVAGQASKVDQASVMQSRQATLAAGAQDALAPLSELEQGMYNGKPTSFNPTSTAARLQSFSAFPDALKSEEQKTYESKKAGWIDSVARAEGSRGGASPAQIARYEKEYFPQQNDPPELVASKRAAREAKTAAIAAGVKQPRGAKGASVVAPPPTPGFSDEASEQAYLEANE